MDYIVLKRDGETEVFDKDKVFNAIRSAFEDIDGSLSNYGEEKCKSISDYIESEVINRANDETGILSVEEIQDLIENKLCSSKRKDVASSYIRYRYKKEVARNFQKDFIDEIRKKLNAGDVQNQNANVDEYSFGGRIGEASDVVTKKLAKDYIISDMAKYNHENNIIYIHDFGSYYVGSHNCLSIPFDDLLRKGFNTRQTDVRPANSINTAFQLLAVIFQLQSLQQFGGVSATHLDWTMVPYLRKSFFKHYLIAYLKSTEEFLKLDIQDLLFDVYEEKVGDTLTVTRNGFEDWIESHKKEFLFKMGLTEKDFYLDNDELDPVLKQSALYDTIIELKQAVEGMYHNLNTLQSRSGNQLPFTSINYGTCTSTEGRLITRELLQGSINGVGKLHKTSIFPCGIFQYMRGVNNKPGTPNYDLYRLALESTSKRLYPNYANVDWSGNEGYDINDPRTYFSTMGCRTFSSADINAEPGQNPYIKDGRGNICPVTIIMPTLAMTVKTRLEKDGTYTEEKLIDEFLSLLDVKINEAKDMLIERFNWIASQSSKAASFMYENGLMLGYKPEEGIVSALKHGTLAVGQLGLAETLQILINCDQTSEKGMELAKRIEQLFKTRCAEFKEEYRLNFGVYYTPAENLAYTAMKKFRDRFGVIPKVSDKDYFTNSIHVPVYDNLSVFDKIDTEAQLTGYSSAGCITYVELDGTVQKNIDALEEIVNYAMEKDIPYFAVNVPNDTCLNCGYTGEFNDKCPACGSTEIQQLRRVTGYLTGDYKSAFNKGKQQETENRVKHVNYME